jgi:hypothetical protein
VTSSARNLVFLVVVLVLSQRQAALAKKAREAVLKQRSMRMAIGSAAIVKDSVSSLNFNRLPPFSIGAEAF